MTPIAEWLAWSRIVRRRTAALMMTLAAATLAGCYSTGAHTPDKRRFPESVPSGQLDFVPETARERLPVSMRLSMNDPGELRLYSFKAMGQSLRVTLSQFAQLYKLNVIVDQDVAGVVNTEFNDLSLEKALDAILDPLGVGWTREDGTIRITRQLTRTYQVDYLRASRTSSSQASSSGGGAGATGSANVSSATTIAFWNDLEEELRSLLTRATAEAMRSGPTLQTSTTTTDARGATTIVSMPIQEVEGRVTINRLSGTVQVTTSPRRMRAVDSFMQNMLRSINRQVYIEARILDVTLTDNSSFGIDWSRISFGPSLSVSASNIINAPAGGASVSPPTVSASYNKAFPANFLVQNISATVRALEEQGAVRVVSQPRVRTLNNQPAVMRVGTERTFYTTQTTLTPVPGGAPTQTVTESPRTVTEGMVLSVTPQISGDGFITLDVTPIINRISAVDASPSGNSNAPRLDTKQTSTLVRLRDGQTAVIGGLIIEEDAETGRGLPGTLQSESGASWLGKGRYSAKVRRELVIFITPHVIDN